jgi:hypothetical protein
VRGAGSKCVHWYDRRNDAFERGVILFLRDPMSFKRLFPLDRLSGHKTNTWRRFFPPVHARFAEHHPDPEHVADGHQLLQQREQSDVHPLRHGGPSEHVRILGRTVHERDVFEHHGQRQPEVSRLDDEVSHKTHYKLCWAQIPPFLELLMSCDVEE